MNIVQLIIALGGFEIVRYVLDGIKFARVEKRLKSAEAKKEEADAFGATVERFIKLSEWQQNEILGRTQEKSELIVELHALKEQLWKTNLKIAELERQIGELHLRRCDMSDCKHRKPPLNELHSHENNRENHNTL